MFTFRKSLLFAAVPAFVAVVLTSLAAAGPDLGQDLQGQVEAHSTQVFGVNQGIPASSQASIFAAQANADPTKLVTLAQPLQAKVVTAGVAGANIDMMALWPDDTNPTWLIACNEQGTTDPGVQRIRMSDGATQTIVTGTTGCDGVRRTPWGTVLFSEEAGGGANGGRVYELIDPLNTTGVSLNRLTGVFSGGTGATNLIARPALGRLSFEGFALYPNGVMYYGDENRPNNGTGGGAYFKFIPSTLWNTANPPITNLTQSPFVGGSIFGLRLGLRSGATDYGQGTETGMGRWFPIPAASDPDLRAQSAALKLTGYYRPEDIDIDQVALKAGNVRFCGANTGNEGDDRQFGNIVCITDGTLAQATANTGVPQVQILVIGNPQFAMMDNMAYQPGRGNWLVHEDGDQLLGNNDLWDCADDGQDDDFLSDGCIRVGTLNDLSAEWTGGIFDATGTRFFVSVQHNVTGHGVVLEITGWK
jgi:secreted PhoX family phosphatase